MHPCLYYLPMPRIPSIFVTYEHRKASVPAFPAEERAHPVPREFPAPAASLVHAILLSQLDQRLLADLASGAPGAGNRAPYASLHSHKREGLDEWDCFRLTNMIFPRYLFVAHISCGTRGHPFHFRANLIDNCDFIFGKPSHLCFGAS